MLTNQTRLVKYSVQGSVAHPIGGDIRIDSSGRPFLLPAIGGITYNVSIGDAAFGWAGDHVEPGVSVKNTDKAKNDALMVFSCIGNCARIVSGEAKGSCGVVTGKHAGIEHLLIHFDESIRAKMSTDDQVLVEAYGQGLQLIDYPDIAVQSLDPWLLEAMDIQERDGKIIVPAVAEIPAYLMGAGIGEKNVYSGDYDMMTGDKDCIHLLGLDKLRMGDIVFLRDCDNVYGRGYRRGAVTVGIVIHSDCYLNGHGPGITTLFSAKTPLIEMRADKDANLRSYLQSR